MARAPLSHLSDWELENSDQDLRGKYLMDWDGNRLGRVDEMIVDTDLERVVALVLDNGKEYPISSVELRDNDAYLLREGAVRTTGVMDRDLVGERAIADRTVVAERDATLAKDRIADTKLATGALAAGELKETETRSIPLIEERLRVIKRAAQVGEVDVRTHVREEQRTIEVPVAHEEVFIERREVTPHPADATVAPREETIRVPLMGEEAMVEKEAVVTGEVVVGKRRVVENRELAGTVRRTEVDVEREGDAEVRTDADRVRPLDKNLKNDRI